MRANLQNGSPQLRTSCVRWALCSLISLACFAQEPPSKAYIDHHDWKIQWGQTVPLGSDFDGETECRSRIIFMVTHIDDRWRDATNLQHEILHALTCENGEVHNLKLNSTSEEKHEGVYFLAPKLVDFARQNPKVMKFFEYAPDKLEKLRCCSIPYDATRAQPEPPRQKEGISSSAFGYRMEFCANPWCRLKLEPERDKRAVNGLEYCQMCFGIWQVHNDKDEAQDGWRSQADGA